jgi:hypothetical protein
MLTLEEHTAKNGDILLLSGRYQYLGITQLKIEAFYFFRADTNISEEHNAKMEEV